MPYTDDFGRQWVTHKAAIYLVMERTGKSYHKAEAWLEFHRPGRQGPIYGPLPYPIPPRYDLAKLEAAIAEIGPAKNTGGAPRKIPQDVVIEAGAWLHGQGIPAKQKDVKDFIRAALFKRGIKAPSETTIGNCVRELLAAHRKAIGSDS